MRFTHVALGDVAIKSKVSDNIAVGCAIAFCAPFAVGGTVMMGGSILLALKPLAGKPPDWIGAATLASAGLLFGFVGYSMIAAVVWGRRELAREAKRKAQFPAEPWRWESRWQYGRVESIGRYVMQLFGAMTGALSFLAIGLMLGDKYVTEGEAEKLLFFFIPLGAMACCGYIALHVVSRWKYGTSVFEIDGGTGVIGGWLLGTVQIPVAIDAPEGIRVRLYCKKITSQGDSRRIDRVWENEYFYPANGGGLRAGGMSVPVRFEVPAGLAESGDVGGIQTEWELELSANSGAPAFHAEFTVPVFKTDAVIQSVPQTMAPLALVQRTASLDPRIVRVESIGNATTITYRRTRNLKRAWVTLLIVAFALLITPAFVANGAAPIAGLFVAGALLMAVIQAIVLARQIVVTVDPGGVTITQDWGIHSSRQIIDATDVAGFTFESSFHSDDRPFYTIRVKTHRGNLVIAGTALPARSDVDQVLGYMEAAFKGEANR